MNTSVTQDVFDVVLARPVITEGGDDPVLVHVWWSAPQQRNRLVQMYLDDELTEVTIDSSQRDIWVLCDRNRMHRIELLAIDASDSEALWMSHQDQLLSWNPPTKTTASVAIIRDEQLSIDSQVIMEVDGEIVDQGAMWPADEHRGGFGSVFGIGEFGYDAATGLGLGVGELGMGKLGADGTAWRWRRSDFEPGTHSLSVRVEDRSGLRVANDAAIGDITIDALPSPASSFSIDSDFVLRWTL